MDLRVEGEAARRARAAGDQLCQQAAPLARGPRARPAAAAGAQLAGAAPQLPPQGARAPIGGQVWRMAEALAELESNACQNARARAENPGTPSGLRPRSLKTPFVSEQQAGQHRQGPRVPGQDLQRSHQRLPVLLPVPPPPAPALSTHTCV